MADSVSTLYTEKTAVSRNANGVWTGAFVMCETYVRYLCR